MGWRDFSWDLIPFVAMITVECTDVGQTTLSKAAMSRGMSPFVYVVYSNAVGTLLLFPSFMIQRRKHPSLTFSLLWKCFLLGLIGICVGQILGFIGIRYSSPTLASAMGNLIPAFTFLLAIIFRMEILDLRKSSSQTKSLGVIVSISGAFIVTLYNGPPIVIIPSPSDVPDHIQLSSQSNWAIGGLFLAATVKEHSSQMTIIFFYCFFGTFQCAIFSFFAERNSNAWMLKPGIELIAIVYSAICGSVYRSIIHTWALNQKGPVYVSMFRPSGIVIAVAMGVTFLGDTFHIGSVIGAVVIAVGFYAVMWGKAKEREMVETNGVCISDPLTQTVPLLPNNVMDP
ncbi:hypothetical protein IFM89_030267 [Coptis chinensis]|uniref:WAT1-related protein n=1 Tax=Coptis chinensis TaxID=261450 RepID=A0A835LXN3_9MAGN|nr:hypothetical protein IFM89_030267 [Coptis chinensis]